MIIKRLFIRDFGIFNNQLLEDLNPGLVVIGGYNRAGKTTLLNLLRHIAFGFPRKKAFISAREQHEVEAIVLLDTGEEVNIHIQGYGTPVVSVLKGNRQISSVSEIYNNLDSFTYSQLFTISLDELQSFSSKNSEKEKLQSILLGAGLKEFVLIPQLEDYFYKEAEKIGGKNGDPKVKELKPYFMRIEEGLRIREEASSQVILYNQKQKEYDTIHKNINEFKNKKSVLEREINRLDILKNNYNLYSNIVELTSKISTDEAKKYLNDEVRFYPEKARNIISKYTEKQYWIKEQTVKLKEKYSISSMEAVIEKINKYKDEIVFLKESLSGLREKINFYFEEKKNLEEEEKQIKNSLNAINVDWQSELKQLEYIRTDQIQMVTLQQNIEQYNKLSFALERETEELEKNVERKTYLEESLKSLELIDPQNRMRFYLIGSVSMSVLGIILALIFNVYFSIISVAGILGLGIFVLYRFIIDKGPLAYKEKCLVDINDLERRISASENKIEGLRSRLRPLEKEINSYKGILGLSKDASPVLLKDYFREIQDIKTKTQKIEEEKENLKTKQLIIEGEMNKILGLLEDFKDLFPLANIDKEADLPVQFDNIMTIIQRIFDLSTSILDLSVYQNELSEYREEAKRLLESSGLDLGEIDSELSISIENYLEHADRKQYYTGLKEEREQLKQQLKAVLNTEMVRETMISSLGDNSEDRIYDAFVELYNEFLSLENVEEKYQEKRTEYENMLNEIEIEQNKLISITKELEELATEETLKNAAIMLDDAHKQLSYLVDEYAVYKTAAFILKKLRETFVQQTKDKLLSGASKYFREITGGEYKAILPPENIIEGDFQAILRDGTIQDSTELLSRGTTEQLFLAIRLSRIREIHPPLPVIIDDSFVNFDDFHLVETLNLVNELANTNQVFLLTCHPNLIELCTEDKPVQYWKLEKGRFSKSTREDLIRYLRFS